MATIDDLYALYNQNLSGRTFEINAREIGGNATVTYYLKFHRWQASHLIGADSNWYEEKAKAFYGMCYPDSWNMVGEYVDNMGDELSAEILVGGVNGVFGYRYNYENDDGTYYPCTCLLVDIRDYTYKPQYKIESISEYKWDV